MHASPTAWWIWSPPPGEDIVRRRRAGHRTGPPSTSAWAVIWSWVVEKLLIYVHYCLVFQIIEKRFVEGNGSRNNRAQIIHDVLRSKNIFYKKQ